jgi:tRNA pseudouridine55 synthase
MRADKSPSPLHGILLVDKPKGWTSHDVVAKTRGMTRQRKIGHTGTLDPMATGLLVLCLGDATRLVQYMSEHDKRYTGEITLGIATDTDDAEGTVLETRTVPKLSEPALRALEQRFTGSLSQRPPAYSAVKVAGQRAYTVARGGGTLELAERAVTVDSIRLRQLTSDRLQIDVHCGPGTYIRSLARDIGMVLGCGAHLSELRRTSVGLFGIESAWTLEGVTQIAASDRLADIMLQPDEGVPEMPAAIVAEANAGLLWHGQVVRIAAAIESEPCSARIYSASGMFVGIGHLDPSGSLRPVKVITNRQQSTDSAIYV